MIYEIYKKTTQCFQDIFTSPKETKGVKLKVNDVELDITEQQFGEYCSPHINITYKGTTYSMDFELFIKKGIEK